VAEHKVRRMRWLCLLAMVAACSSSTSQLTDAGVCETPACAPPTGLTAGTGSQFALIHWNAASGSVIDYRVTATPQTGNPITHQETQTSLLLGGLTNGVAYRITVASSTAAGTGPASAAVLVTPQGLCSRGFALYRSFPAGTSPSTVVAADLDNDGFADLAVTQANGLTVLINDQNADFSKRTDYPLSTSPGFLIAADFDNSGLPDLVASGSTTTLFLNDGAGRFDGGVDLGFASTTLTTGDLSLTGLPDLVAGSSPGTSARVLAFADGGFSDAGIISLGFAPGFIAIGDFNADTSLDLAAVNPLQSGVNLSFTNADGGPPVLTALDAGSAALSLVAADFNADGLIDLVAGGADGQLHVMYNDGGVFAAPLAFDAGAPPGFLVAADLDLDAFNDLVYTASAQNLLGVMFNAQDGGFAPPLLYPTGNQPSSVAVADFNNDGFPDLAVANTQDGTISIYLNICR
jgi:hypothetical protein